MRYTTYPEAAAARRVHCGRDCDLDFNLNLNLIVGGGFSFLLLMITDDGAILLIKMSTLYTQ